MCVLGWKVPLMRLALEEGKGADPREWTEAARTLSILSCRETPRQELPLVRGLGSGKTGGITRTTQWLHHAVGRDRRILRTVFLFRMKECG